MVKSSHAKAYLRDKQVLGTDASFELLILDSISPIEVGAEAVVIAHKGANTYTAEAVALYIIVGEGLPYGAELQIFPDRNIARGKDIDRIGNSLDTAVVADFFDELLGLVQ